MNKNAKVVCLSKERPKKGKLHQVHSIVVNKTSEAGLLVKTESSETKLVSSRAAHQLTALCWKRVYKTHGPGGKQHVERFLVFWMSLVVVCKVGNQNFSPHQKQQFFMQFKHLI